MGAGVLLADGGIWPVLIFWAVFALIGRAAAANKKKGLAPRPANAPQAGERAPQTGLLGELRRAMEELKRAELEQRAQADQRTQIEVFQQPPGEDDERKRQRARQFLEKKKAEALQKRAAKQALPVRRKAAPLPDSADMSSEASVAPLEGRDYDDEAEAIISKRRAAAERHGRDESSLEELTELQRSRRAGRPDEAIGTQAEHDAWHTQLGSEAPPARRAGKGPLARFADGSLRSAVILGEILGRPKGERTGNG